MSRVGSQIIGWQCGSSLSFPLINFLISKALCLAMTAPRSALPALTAATSEQGSPAVPARFQTLELVRVAAGTVPNPRPYRPRPDHDAGWTGAADSREEDWTRAADSRAEDWTGAADSREEDWTGAADSREEDWTGVADSRAEDDSDCAVPWHGTVTRTDRPLP